MQFLQSAILFALPAVISAVATDAPSQGKLVPIYRHEAVGCIDENVNWTTDTSACATFEVTPVDSKKGTKYTLSLNGVACGSDPNTFVCSEDEQYQLKFFFDGDLLGNPVYVKRPNRKYFYYGGPPPTDDPIPVAITSTFGDRFNLQWQEV